MELVVALIPYVIVFGIAALVGLCVARVSALRNPVVAQWATHPWWWFAGCQASALAVLVVPPAQPLAIACGLLIGLPSAVQGLRLAAQRSRARYWLLIGLGLAFVLVPRVVQNARGIPVTSSLFNSPIVLLPWAFAAYIARRCAPLPGPPPTRETPAVSGA